MLGPYGTIVRAFRVPNSIAISPFYALAENMSIPFLLSQRARCQRAKAAAASMNSQTVSTRMISPTKNNMA